jgi:DNA invertase Pin-like site-specific DNA recombinase
MTFVEGQQKPYQWRRLTPEQEAAVLGMRQARIRVALIARSYGVSKRTIYRILERRRQPTVTVRIRHWKAPFIVTDEGPMQAGPWVPR